MDKTRFLRPLEDERFVFLIRPRRFGKSCWLSFLENYYDRKWASEFEQVFGGTDIGREPTENRHGFVTLRFDFSVVRDAEMLEGAFEEYCGMVIRRSLGRHPDLFPQQEAQRLLAGSSTQAKLSELFWWAADRGIREAVAGDVRLHIPNQTVRQLLYGHLRDAYDDVGVLSVDLVFFAGLLRRMAREGEWQPVFDFLRDAIAEQTSIRDYLDGEKIIQGFLAAYLGVSPHFLMRTEPELGKGFADIPLEPLVAQHPELRHGYLIELKYLKRAKTPARRRCGPSLKTLTSSCGATWRTIAWRGRTPPHGSPAWRWCSTVGRWSLAKRRRHDQRRGGLRRVPAHPLRLGGLPRHAHRRPPVRGQDALPPPLENERFVFLIRPRRFGKSCWLSLLENYYDRKWASEFEQVFGGTDIGREPTENRHSFVVLRFDFSEVRDAPETLEREFEYYCGEVIQRSMERHPALFPPQEVQRILAAPSTPPKADRVVRLREPA